MKSPVIIDEPGVRTPAVVAATTPVAQRQQVVGQEPRTIIQPPVVRPQAFGVTPTVTTPAPTVVNITNNVTKIVNPPTVASGTPGDVQFTDGSGKFVTDKDFKYNPATDTLVLNGELKTSSLVVNGSASFSSVSSMRILGGTAQQVLQTNGSGQLSWVTPYSNANAQTFLQYYLPNNTSDVGGTLIGNIHLSTVNNVRIADGNVGETLYKTAQGTLGWRTDAYYTDNNVAAYLNLHLPNNTTHISTTNFTATGIVNLGEVENVHIIGGSSNQVLSTDGNGNLSWLSQDKLKNELAGANTQIQFNDDNVHGASANLTFNKATNTFTTENIIANNFTLGNATESVRNEFWFKASTHSTANSVILVMPSANVAGLDVTIVATEGTRARKISKILVATLGSVTNHSEYSTRYVGPNPGDFDVNQIGQNIALSVKPTTANTVVYNMIVTTYKD
jgi:hypothetical protein